MSSDSRTEPRVLVLVCTYNERKNIAALVEAIGKSLPSADLLVVDDGSPDGRGLGGFTIGIEADVEVASTRRETRLGTAIKQGLLFGIDKGYDFVVNLDADFSHDPAVLPILVESTVKESADLTIGSRYVDGGGLRNCSWRRHFVSRAANFCARRLVGWKIRDCSSAFRCYRTDFLSKLDLGKIECKGYGFLEEILFAVLQSGGRVIERPIIYTEREFGESKISMREAIGTFSVLWQLGRKA